jgi:hypothetical protein
MYHLEDKKTKEEKRNDVIANLFLEPAFEAIFLLIKGSSTQEAFNGSQLKYLNNLRLAIKENNPNLNTIAASLYHNLSCQVCLGDNNACF